MLKNDFVEKLNRYNIGDSLYHLIILLLAKEIEKFKDIFNFDIEGDRESVSICIENKGVFLFIDLNNEIFNLRYMHIEFYFFIEEISLDEFKKIIENFFNGKYKLKTYLHADLVIKKELIFNDIDLSKYNQEDFYGKTKNSNNVIEDVGYNWFDNV